MNPFWLATIWAVVFVLAAAAVVLGNSLAQWGLSAWWALALAVIGFAPICGMVYWMLAVMTRE